MVTLAELIAQSQEAFSGAFLKAAGPTGFSLLPAETQVSAAEVIAERAALTRSIFPTGTTGVTQFIQQQSQDIVNLFKLGQASVDISGALSEQVQIREQQLSRTQEQIRNQGIAVGQINERLSRQVTELGQSISQLSTGEAFDPIKFFTENPIIGGIGIGGLLVGGLVLLIALR